MKRIFISYSRKDIDFAKQLSIDLEAYGAVVWRDERELRVGDSIIRKIREGIDHADLFIAIITQHSIGSEWVQREIDVATTYEIDTGNKKVLPVLAGKANLPGFLQGKLYADFTKTYEYGLASLLSAIQFEEEINVMAAVLISHGLITETIEFFKHMNFEDVTPLHEIEYPVSLEITGGYFSVMRGTGPAFLNKPYVFQPHSRLELCRDIPQLRLNSTIVVFGPFTPYVFKKDPTSSKELNRCIIYIIGTKTNVKSTIDDFLKLPRYSTGLTDDLHLVLEWWSNPIYINNVPPVKIDPIWQSSAMLWSYSSTTGLSAKETQEYWAIRWKSNNCDPAYLIRDRELLALVLWRLSAGAKKEDEKNRTLLEEFEKACVNAQPKDWYDEILSEKDNCQICGESYRLENVLICSNCRRPCCYRCTHGASKAKNGNTVCVCGGEFVP